jgi:succinate-semialdehyde dehydrogenase/glutarate-semialdehyde dehydrogenase
MAALGNQNLQGESTFDTVSQIFLKARVAQKKWAEVSFSDRKTYLEKMSRYIIDHTDRIVDILCKDTGKTKTDALADEVFPCAFACRWYGENAESILRERKLKTSIALMRNKQSSVMHLPLGVIGIISPWNYPLSIPFGEVVMGLMAGNAVVLKTSHEVTPYIGPLILEIIESSGLPDGVFQLIEAPGAECADAFFANRVDKIFFTGSVRVGKELMRKASETLTPLSLELGGNDPMIVLEDADLERATNGAAWGGYQNAGQTCAGIERVYVHANIYESFVELLAKKTRALRHGHFENPDVDIGAVTTVKQFESIKSHVDEALKKGARIVAQSQPCENVDGLYFPATLMVDVNHSMMIMKEETFGPVLCVMKFRNEEEAIAFANDSKYALTSSVWTRDAKKGRRLALQLESGVTTLNDHLLTHGFSETPWGGWKESGIGRTHGAAGLKEMTHCKVVNEDRLASKRNVYWYPAGRETFDNLKTGLKLSFARTPLEFMRYAWSFLPYALKKSFSKWEV